MKQVAFIAVLIAAIYFLTNKKALPARIAFGNNATLNTTPVDLGANTTTSATLANRLSNFTIQP